MKTIIDRKLFDRLPSKTEGFEAFEQSLAVYTERSNSSPEYQRPIHRNGRRDRKAKPHDLLTLSAAENTKELTRYCAANLAILLRRPEAPRYPLNTPTRSACKRHHTWHRGRTSSRFEQGALRALFIMGEDPLTAFPFSSKIQSVLKSLDLLIVQDIALTETAKIAHIVLPAAAWAEKDGTFTNAEGITQKLQRIVDSQGQALPDWQILRNLSLAMGKEVGTRSAEGLTEEIRTTAQQEHGISGIRVFHDVSMLK
jgi:anaerobic selenocysteine-containing dehydrogenase